MGSGTTIYSCRGMIFAARNIWLLFCKYLIEWTLQNTTVCPHKGLIKKRDGYFSPLLLAVWAAYTKRLLTFYITWPVFVHSTYKLGTARREWPECNVMFTERWHILPLWQLYHLYGPSRAIFAFFDLSFVNSESPSECRMHTADDTFVLPCGARSKTQLAGREGSSRPEYRWRQRQTSY